jgi:hypothetical protein
MRHSASFSSEEVLGVEAVLSKVINSTDRAQRRATPELLAAYRKFLSMKTKALEAHNETDTSGRDSIA